MSKEDTLPQAATAKQGAAMKEGLVIGLLGFTVILIVMNTMMFNLALPKITQEFGLTSIGASWIVTGYSIVFAISAITYTRLSDFVPIRKLFTIGLACLGAASILGFFSHNFLMLLCARLLQASGAAAVPGLAIVLVTRFIPITRNGRAMSIIMSASSLGLGLGPVIGGSITQFLGWNSLFLVTGISLLLIPFFYRLLPQEKAQAGTFDFVGAVFIGVGTTGLLLYLTSRSWLMLAVGLVALLSFWVRIHRARNPFVSPALFRNKPYLMLSSLGIVSYINNFATLFLLPQVLAHLFALTPGESGLIIFPGAIISMVASNWIGKMIDRYGNDLLLRYAPLLLLVAAATFALLVGWSFYAIMVSYMLLSIGFSALTTSVSNEMARILHKEEVGAGMGLFQLTQFFSGAFSVAVTGSTLASQKGIALTDVYAEIFWGMTAVAVLAILCSIGYHFMKQARARRMNVGLSGE
ncbi:UNVERIFIED_CONTAM: DHA2 family metal-tetracycline-proton antiporter-like MFS transporter [Brevibacillus sp. OAP136]